MAHPSRKTQPTNGLQCHKQSRTQLRQGWHGRVHGHQMTGKLIRSTLIQRKAYNALAATNRDTNLETALKRLKQWLFLQSTEQGNQTMRPVCGMAADLVPSSALTGETRRIVGVHSIDKDVLIGLTSSASGRSTHMG